MAVVRIVANIATSSVDEVASFYCELLSLDTVMDLGWIKTLSADKSAPVQLSIMTEGGSGSAVPALSIEVDDVDATHRRAQQMGAVIEYALTDEPWGARRFYLRDPAGTLVNILSHSG